MTKIIHGKNFLIVNPSKGYKVLRLLRLNWLCLARQHRIWSFHVAVLRRTTKKCTKNYNARAQPLFCSLNLLFGDVLVAFAAAVVFCVRSLIVQCARRERQRVVVLNKRSCFHGSRKAKVNGKTKPLVPANQNS